MGSKGSAKKWSDLARDMGWQEDILVLRLFVLYVLRILVTVNPKIADSMLDYYFLGAEKTTPAKRNYHVRGRETLIAIYGVLRGLYKINQDGEFLYEHLMEHLLADTHNEVSLIEEINYLMGENYG